MNICYLAGHVGNFIDSRKTQSGRHMLSFSLATNEKYDQKVQTHWHRILFFGGMAERISPLIQKGAEVFVYGKISPREYTDKNGNKKTSNDIIASEVKVIQKPAQVNHEENAYAAPQESFGALPSDAEDIPW